MKTEQASYTAAEVEAAILEATEKTRRQEKEFSAQVIRSLPGLDPQVKQAWAEKPKELAMLLNNAFAYPVVFPPKKGEVRTLTVEVDWDKTWEKAVREAASPGEATHPACDDLVGAEKYYRTNMTGITTSELVLVRMGPYDRTEWANTIAWANRFNLRRTHPREVLSMVEKTRDSIESIEGIAATEEKKANDSSQLCLVYFGNWRDYQLPELEDTEKIYRSDLNPWYAFARKQPRQDVCVDAV